MNNLPSWPGASKAYSKAYRFMETYGADDNLIEALNIGDEERIKAILLDYNYRQIVENQNIEKS